MTKLEYLNPGGSHKTRAARHILQEALGGGGIVPGRTTVIEKTGGNFGMGLAVECGRLGIDLELVIGLSFSGRKKAALRRMGADVVGQNMLVDGWTPREVVEWRLANQERLGREYYYTNQFANELGVAAHYQDTGAELALQLRQLGCFRDHPLTLVKGAGTGASVTGIARRLREEFSDVRVLIVEPEGCEMRRERHVEHPMEGMSVGVVAPFLDFATVDGWRHCDEVLMQETACRAARQSGILLGNTAAATLAVALQEGASQPDRLAITIAYDAGYWYV